MLFAHLHLLDGDVIPPHRHPWPSLYYVVAGPVALLADDGWHDTDAGGLVMTPPGVDHGIRASGDVDLVEVQSNCPRSFFERVVAGLTIADLLGG